jgi:hypothetical protein
MTTKRFGGVGAVHWPQLVLLMALPLWWSWTQTWSAMASIGLWLLVNLVVLAFAERLQPHRDDWHPTAAHLRRDGGVFALNTIADGLATLLLAAAAVALSFADNAWPLWVQIAIALPLAELGSYWMHRWSHGDNPLWRAHLLHHRPERVNVANAMTAHPVNAVYDKLARFAPMTVLGFDEGAVLAVALFGLTQSLVAHANIAGGIGSLDYAIGSARLHRLHHSTREDEAGNFGTALPLWDQLFGTYRRGGSPAAVGVFEPRRYPGELDLRALLQWPFVCGLCRRLAACCRA